MNYESKKRWWGLGFGIIGGWVFNFSPLGDRLSAHGTGGFFGMVAVDIVIALLMSRMVNHYFDRKASKTSGE